jgi:hypothetical protein
MLSEAQIKRVWGNMLAAETRALYFGDLASRYTHQKQWITGISFFLSSGAAASIISKAPAWIPLVLALIVAALTAYAMAVNLDGKIATMIKLHSAWSVIATNYDSLWNHTYEDEAEDRLNQIVQSEREPSEIATTDAPNDQKLLGKWQDRVYHLSSDHG